MANTDLIQPLHSEEDDEFLNNSDYLINAIAGNKSVSPTYNYASDGSPSPYSRFKATNDAIKNLTRGINDNN